MNRYLNYRTRTRTRALYNTSTPLINAGLLVAVLCERPYFSTYIYTYLHTYLPIYIPPYPSTS